MGNRELTLMIGSQASGKTYQLKRAIIDYEQNQRCDCVHVCDPFGELSTQDWAGHDAIVVTNASEYHSHVAVIEHRIPRIVLWRCESGEPAFRAAIEQGKCCVVLDEAYHHAPGGPTWKGSCQYPRSVHHLIYDQANCILCSKLRGEQAKKWIREYAGQEALERTEQLELHEWAVIGGKRPRWL